jgi:hypothetical protein
VPIDVDIRATSVRLTVTGYPAGHGLAYVLRDVPGRPLTVAGPGGAGTATTTVVTDWEIPFGIPTTYTAGVAGDPWAATVTVTLPLPAAGGVTLRDTRPDGVGLPDVCTARLLADVTFEVPPRSVVHNVIGDPVPRWSIHPPGAELGRLNIRIDGATEWARLRDVIDSGHPIHVRSCRQDEWADGRIMPNGPITVARGGGTGKPRPWLVTIPYVRCGLGDLA